MARVSIFCALFLTQVGWGAQLSLDAGALMTNVAGRSQTETGLQSQVSRIAAYLRFRSHFPLASWLGWEPALGIVVPWRSNQDGTARTLTTRLEIPFTLGGRSTRFRLGAGFELNTIFPQGGEVELNNGVTTSTFYIPSSPSSSLLLMVHGGGVVGISQSIALTLDLYVTGIADSQRRRFHSALGVAWVI